MLEKTKDEAKLRGTEESVKRIELVQNDTIEQLRLIDDNLANDLLKLSQKKNEEKESANDILSYADDDIYSPINIEKISNAVSIKEDFEFNNIDSDVQYDIVELPSKGQCYKEKFSRVPVSYLTAYDENFITSPNLYKDGLVIDYLLKHKIMNKNINIEELCSGDVDAITLFLRITSYGPEYPIIVKDPETGEDIETVIDLSKLKIKDFNLESDENGLFEYVLPISKGVVKFRFLTRKDKRILEKLSSIEEYGVKAMKVNSMLNEISKMIQKDDILTGKEKQAYLENINKMEEWTSKLRQKESKPFTKTITNRMEMSIVSINGNEDRSYISKYVRNMSARDALMLRRYIVENEPGVDFSIEVERPLSLGGGSINTFLEWEDTVFLNIT
jgi:hypothetical protein